MERAASLTDDLGERGGLLDRAGWLAVYASDYGLAERLLSESAIVFETGGNTHAAARVSGRLSWVEWTMGRYDESLARAERAFAAVRDDEPDDDVGLLASILASGYLFTGDLERAHEHLELALEIGESLGAPLVIARGLGQKGILMQSRGRKAEALALWKQALVLAREHDLTDESLSCLVNLSDSSFQDDRYDDALGYLREGLELARRRGSRPHEWTILAETTYSLYRLGRWHEALDTAAQIPEDRLRDSLTLSLLCGVLEIHLHRGRLDEARALVDVYAGLESAADIQDRSSYLTAKAALARAEGRLAEAAALGREGAELARGAFGAGSQTVKQGLVEAAEAELALGELSAVEEVVTMIEEIPPGRRPPFLDAQCRRFRARLAGANSSAEAAFAEASERFRDLGMVFWAAVADLELAEWLAGHGRSADADPLLDGAGEAFERLEATPWLDRVAELRQTVGATSTGSLVG